MAEMNRARLLALQSELAAIYHTLPPEEAAASVAALAATASGSAGAQPSGEVAPPPPGPKTTSEEKETSPAEGAEAPGDGTSTAPRRSVSLSETTEVTRRQRSTPRVVPSASATAVAPRRGEPSATRGRAAAASGGSRPLTSTSRRGSPSPPRPRAAAGPGRAHSLEAGLPPRHEQVHDQGGPGGPHGRRMGGSRGIWSGSATAASLGARPRPCRGGASR